MTRKRRILFLHLGHAFGGIEVYLSNLAQLLREDAKVVALCSHPELIERLQAQSVQVLKFPKLTGPLRGMRFLLAAVLLPFVVWKHRIDTVHINGHWESVLLAPARLIGCRAITTHHQTWNIPLRHWWHEPKRTLSSLVSNVNARFAHLVICVSEAVASEVRRVVAADKIIVIPNWISCSPHFLHRVNHQGKTRLLFVGRMVTVKGLPLLLDAVRDMSEVSLTVVGDGAMLTQFQRQAMGLDVCFAGFHQNVQPFYDAADIFVMPSLGLEGLPLVSIEAMGNGLPCLFSDLPVHREISDAGRTARLFRTGNAADLKQQLCSLIADEKQREQLARAAYQRVKALYTAEAAHGSYLKAFDLATSAAFPTRAEPQPEAARC
jgi:glycosyltransferase involved in cell wall biosynthesis